MLAEVKNICVVEDEVEIAEVLKSFFESGGYHVSLFKSAEEFYKGKRKGFKGIYLIDWNLPGDDGLNIIAKIREYDQVSPIFMISAFNDPDQIVEGLSAGADDYITKPFNLDELNLRVENSLKKFSIVHSRLKTEKIKLLPKAHSFIKDNVTISLTAKEFALFIALLGSHGEPVSRDDLASLLVSGTGKKKAVRTVDVHIVSLRQKLMPVSLFIDTIWGKGYSLSEY